MHADPKADIDLLEGGDGDVNLSQVQLLINVMRTKERELEDLETKAKAVKNDLEDLKTRKIPDAMGHLKSVKTQDGATVSIEPVVRANILKDNRELAYHWFDEHGHGDLIKTEVSLAYGRSQLEEAKRTMDKLKEMGLKPTLAQDIHWATLNAFVKEQLNKGMEFPEFIGVFEGKTTKVKYGK